MKLSMLGSKHLFYLHVSVGNFAEIAIDFPNNDD